MSHTVKIQTQFKDMYSLRKALEEMGWTIKENSKLRNYGHDNKTYKLIAVNPSQESNAYDLAIEEVNGELQVLGDFFGGSVAKTLGENLCKLKQKYACKVIENEYTQQGYIITTETLANGHIVVNAEQ